MIGKVGLKLLETCLGTCVKAYRHGVELCLREETAVVGLGHEIVNLLHVRSPLIIARGLCEDSVTLCILGLQHIVKLCYVVRQVTEFIGLYIVSLNYGTSYHVVYLIFQRAVLCIVVDSRPCDVGELGEQLHGVVLYGIAVLLYILKLALAPFGLGLGHVGIAVRIQLVYIFCIFVLDEGETIDPACISVSRFLYAFVKLSTQGLRNLIVRILGIRSIGHNAVYVILYGFKLTSQITQPVLCHCICGLALSQLGLQLGHFFGLYVYLRLYGSVEALKRQFFAVFHVVGIRLLRVV